MHTRRVLGVAAATATVMGLVLPAQPASAQTTCVFTDNATTQTHSLTADCLLDSTWVVEDGWTIDGNGHTVTADATGAFTGPGVVIESAAGTGGAAPKTMNVKHLTIQALHFHSATGHVAGILFDGAGGRVSDVRISGVSDGTATDNGFGVEVDNSVGAGVGTGLTPPQVKVDNGTTISGYQRAAIYAHGEVKLNVLQAVVQGPDAISGEAVAGVRMTDGTHGSVKESHISLADTEPANASQFGAGVEIVKDNSSLPRRIEVKRNVLSGTNADFGISVSNPFPTAKLTAATDCNLFRRSDTSASDPYGVGVGQWESSSKTNVQVTNSTFQGNWKRSTGTITGTTVTAGPPNTLDPTTSTCVPSAATHVKALGGDHRSKVTWHAGAALDYAPLTGFLVKAKAAGHRAVKKKVGPKATSAVLKGLSNKAIYVVTVTARSNGGDASATDHLYPTKMSLSAQPGTIHRGAKATLHGRLATRDPHGKLGKRKVGIWAKPQGGRWTKIDTVRTTSTGSFSEVVRPHKRTSYRATYAGRPDLASSAHTTVAVTP
jgi:hypothetical protein